MTLYVAGGSITRCTRRPEIKTYVELLRGTLLNDFQGGIHNLLYTVMLADYETRNLKLKKKDAIVFNFGVNDCVYRKNKKVQLTILDLLCARAVELDEPEILKHFQGVRDRMEKKGDDELIRFLSIREFRKYCRKVFERFPGQGIVLSTNWAPKDNKRIGYAYKEIVKANQVMGEECIRAGLIFIDLFEPPNRTYDSIHLTEEGHKYVAKEIKEVRKCL